MKKKYLLIALLTGITLVSTAQNTCQKAKTAFENSEYDRAISYYNMCKVDFGTDVSKEIKTAKQCQELLVIADKYFNAKDYVNAAKNYFDILTLNPKDKKADNRQNEIRKTAGIEYYDNGYYTGAFNNNDKRHGQGTYHWNTGNYYEGLWANGEPAGRGIYYSTDGTTETGSYVNGNWIADMQKTTEPEKKEKGTFGALGYMFSPTSYLGFFAGGCGNRFGGYASLKTHLLSEENNVTNINNLDVDFNKYQHRRFAISAGGMMRLFDDCYWYAGVGYGTYGKAYKINNYSSKDAYYLPEVTAGLDVETGLIYSFGKWYLSAGYNTLLIKERVQDFSIGIGMSIK